MEFILAGLRLAIFKLNVQKEKAVELEMYELAETLKQSIQHIRESMEKLEKEEQLKK